MKILLVVGTRPNFMKVEPVMRALSRRDGVEQRLVHTGQHYDSAMSDAFFEDLELPHPDHFLSVGSGTHGEQTARVILGLEPVLVAESPDVIVVAGDVNSTAAAAMTAVKLGTPIAHLESGLRSGDRSMPEEHNRVVTDHLSDVLLTTTREAGDNLRHEGIRGDRIAFVGNTMIDSVRRHEAQARAMDLARSEYQSEDHLLVTLHRPALVDDPGQLSEVMAVLEDVAVRRPVLFPIHPRTSENLRSSGWSPGRVRLVEPQSYVRFLSLMLSASAVLTDSGGLQEETSALGVPCFTLRRNTERPVTVTEGTNRLLGLGREALNALQAALDGPLEIRPRQIEGWDGRAGERTADELVKRYGAQPASAAQASTVTAAE